MLWVIIFVTLFYLQFKYIKIKYLQLVNHGSLLNDFSPAVNPPAEIEDVNDRKPEDWDEREKVKNLAQKFLYAEKDPNFKCKNL